MARRSNGRCYHEFRGLLEIIVVIVLDGLTSRCNTKEKRPLKISCVMNVMPTDNFRRIVACPMDFGEKLLFTSNFKR